jgi:hypothetical protein
MADEAQSPRATRSSPSHQRLGVNWIRFPDTLATKGGPK